jgi:hypothetical protein
MTVAQIAILGCMALSFCGVLVGGYLGLGALVSSAYQPDPALLTLSASLTPPPPTIPAPTQTPLPTATLTAVPYEALIPAGWKQFTTPKAPGMEIWLPSSYVPANQIKNSHDIQLVQSDSDEAITTLLSLVDQTKSPYLIYTSFGMGTAPVRDATLDDTIDRVFGKMMRVSTVVERKDFVLGHYDARKLVFDVSANGVDVGMVYYLIRIGDKVWYLVFSTPFNELDTHIPVFDQVMQTFRLLPVTPTSTITPTVPSPTNTPLR